MTYKEKKSTQILVLLEFRRYLSLQEVALQLLSARVSLTTVFGMGTGGPSA